MNAHGLRRRFGPFELDVQGGQLRRNGRAVRIQPQPLRVLEFLIERAGEIVTRGELQRRIWDQATFVEFDQGLNYCIRQIRLALGDDAATPAYVETLVKQGYRFIAPVTDVLDLPVQEGSAATELPLAELSTTDKAEVGSVRRKAFSLSSAIILVLALAAVGGGWWVVRANSRSSTSRRPVAELQITDFPDSAIAPTLSPDGRMVAFIRGNSDFLTPDQIYLKMLPEGVTTRLTDDPRLKYGPVFSYDGTEVAYTVMENAGWSTYAVSVLGGQPHLILSNAAGLTWLDGKQLLFSQVKNGQHMGIVTGTATRANFRELYYPAHERAMAHYAYVSPDRSSAIVVEMNERGAWQPCRLMSLNGGFQSRTVGPFGACTSAGWAPDGQWMYFSVAVDVEPKGSQTAADVAGQGGRHLWRQRVPDGAPEQLTFGPTSEAGVAVDPDGRSLVTSVGVEEDALWIHEWNRDRALVAEGPVREASFSGDGRFAYFVQGSKTPGAADDLQRVTKETGERESLFPGVSVRHYDISPDGTQALYTTGLPDGRSQVWLVPIDRSAPARKIGVPGDASPYFGPDGEILFSFTEGRFNYLGRMNRDGSGRSTVVPYPISQIEGISPARTWVMAIAPLLDRTTVAVMAIPVHGGSPIRICQDYCHTAWSTNGQFLFVSVEEASVSNPGRSLAIPVGPGEALPAFPQSGIPPRSDATIMAGARSVGRAQLIPGAALETFMYVRPTVLRNLFRVTLP